MIFESGIYRDCPQQLYKVGEQQRFKPQPGTFSIDEVGIANSRSLSTLGGSISGLFGSKEQPAIVVNQEASEHGYRDGGKNLKYRAHRYGPIVWFAWAIGWTLFGAFIGFCGLFLAWERGRIIIGWALFFLGLFCGGFGAWSLIYGWPWLL